MSTEELLEIANAPATEEQEAEEELKELISPTQESDVG